MGHKVNPIALRIGFIKNWQSMWFAKHNEFPKSIEEDYRIRKFIKKNFKQAAISKVIIERLAQRVRIRIHTARPGIIIGRHGADIERLRGDINGMVNKEVSIDIEEVKEPSLDAQLISENVALQLEKRVAYRRAIKRVIEQAMSGGAQGVRIVCSGRLGGAEMSRKETYKQGKIPLQTLRADIDYGFAEALTTYGLIGIKTWVYKGDILFSKDKEPVAVVEAAAEDKDKKAKEAGGSKEAPAA
ncbi:MAG: 30S ribosomal protein S3 [Candidatus Omnitrophica bacterium]|jgi:small subunit ribosomal protein S3|nr:30S ribosomal protein S3 [Candidatus Omnitrophota bacterium]MDD5654102.1 30S ribosomal protein S3 [Candidatus Omnitrophota bacterium]